MRKTKIPRTSPY